MRSILFVIVIFFPWFLQAQEIFPNGCVPVVVDGQLATLSAEKYALIGIHNLSNNDLWLIHPGNVDGSQVQISGKLSADKWSSLVLNKQTMDFNFNCVESRPGHEQQVACRDVLAICQWPNAKVPEDRKGVFWLAEDMDMLPLTAYIERLGFSLS